MGEHEDEHEYGTQGTPDVAVANPEVKLRPPRMYKVILINDDYTPMEFVIEVLMTYFSMPSERANQVMLQVHTEGQAVCGVFNRDVAETKVTQVNQFARKCQHPLLCEMDEE